MMFAVEVLYVFTHENVWFYLANIFFVSFLSVLVLTFLMRQKNSRVLHAFRLGYFFLSIFVTAFCVGVFTEGWGAIFFLVLSISGTILSSFAGAYFASERFQQVN
jgi:CDP-diglyceride synthetase